MNGRKLTVLTALAGVLTIGESAALAAGARGYVLKGATAAEITPALATVAAGGAGIASRMLDLLAGGASNRQIARALGLSLKTVQNHVSRILDKLQAADRTQAVLRARRAGHGSSPD
jgi:DNA-binding NarL/FixJ family response regulator